MGPKGYGGVRQGRVVTRDAQSNNGATPHRSPSRGRRGRSQHSKLACDEGALVAVDAVAGVHFVDLAAESSD